MKVNDIQQSVPKSFQVKYGQSITAEAISQTYNQTNYNFDSWSDGYTFSWRSITPNSNENHTAYFVGKPQQVQNVFFDCDIGDPVKLVWDQHPNANCNYRIYRKTRDQWGNITGPTLIATRLNGTTSYTDHQYNKARTYVYLLSYDVRAYYTVENTEADPNLKHLFGMPGFKTDSLHFNENTILNTPLEFDLTNFPNPFNLTTKINFNIVEDQNVRLIIYSVTGEKVITLLKSFLPKGSYKIDWDGRNRNGNLVSSGIYIYELISGKERIVRKMLLSK